MTTITIDKELLEQVVNKLLTCWPKSDPLVNELRAALAAPATAPDLSAAYIGAREDLAIWKKRALEAEETARQLNRALAEEVNGPTFMGEPVLPATAPAWNNVPTCEGLWLCDEGDENPYRFTCHDISMPLNPHLAGEGERWYGPIPEDKS